MALVLSRRGGYRKVEGWIRNGNTTLSTSIFFVSFSTSYLSSSITSKFVSREMNMLPTLCYGSHCLSALPTWLSLLSRVRRTNIPRLSSWSFAPVCPTKFPTPCNRYMPHSPNSINNYKRDGCACLQPRARFSKCLVSHRVASRLSSVC